MEDSKGHDSACHQERQSQDVNSLHGLQVYRSPKKILLTQTLGGIALYSHGEEAEHSELEGWPAGLSRLRSEQPDLTPLPPVQGLLPPCRERAVGLARCHLTQNKEVLVKPGTEKDIPKEI